VRGILIPAEGLPLSILEWDGTWQRGAEAIGANFIQHITICGYPNPMVPLSNLVMLMDEDGLLKSLRVNPRASRLYGVSYHGHRVVGNALLTGLSPRGWIDLPREITTDRVEQMILERTRKP
jgi:hypothetical protein